MVQVTALSPTALPGLPYVFVAKTEAIALALGDTFTQRVYRNSLVDAYDLAPAEFARSSVAHWPSRDRSSMESYAANTPRYDIRTVTTASDGEWVASYVPWTKVGTTLIGSSTFPHNGIWTSTDGGDNWSQTSDINCTGAWALESGALLVLSTEGGLPYKLYWSAPTQLGADLQSGSLPDPVVTFEYDVGSGEYTYPHYWNVLEAGDTICVSSYSPAGNGTVFGRKIYRSTDDGATFTLIHTESDIRHCHAVGYHAATAKWLQSCGDGVNVNRILESNDDGLTWTELVNHESSGESTNAQPLWFHDFGDATKLLVGADSYLMVYLLDVTTGLCEQVWTDGHRAKQLFCYNLFQSGGLYYALASGSTSDANPKPRTLLVSSDYRNWAALHRFTANEHATGWCIGLTNSQLHWAISDSAGTRKHFRITPPSFARKVTSVICEPTVTNLYSADQSTKLDGWGTVDCTIAEETTEQFSGNSAKVTLDAGETVGSVFKFITGLTPENRYNVRAWVRGGDNQGYGQLYARALNGGLQNMTPQHNFNLGPYWQEVEGLVDTSNAGKTQVDLILTFRVETAGQQSFYVGAVQLIEAEVPTSWQIGGTARTAETITYDLTMPARWTHYLAVAPTSTSDYYEGHTLYIATWKVDATNFVRVYWDGDNLKLGLERTVAGAAQTPVESDAIYIGKDAVLKLALRCTSSALTLSYLNGGAVVHLAADGTISGLYSDDVTVNYGDEDGANLMPMVVCQDWVRDGVDTDANTATELQTVVGEHLSGVFDTVDAETYLDGAVSAETYLDGTTYAETYLDGATRASTGPS